MKIAKYAASYALEELLKSIGERLILRDSIMSIAVARFVMANYKTDDMCWVATELWPHRVQKIKAAV